MKTYYVLFNNDSPELVYDNAALADAEASKRQRKHKEDAKARGSYLTAYWHTHEVPEAP